MNYLVDKSKVGILKSCSIIVAILMLTRDEHPNVDHRKLHPLPMVYKNMYIFTEFKADMHNIFIKVNKNLTK